MILYLDVCLEKNKSREGKDGLHQYHNQSQSQAPGSFEIVILYLVEKAEKKHCEAKEAAAMAERCGDSDDAMDELTVWRSVLLSMMSQDPEKMGRKTLVVLPSLKFL